MTRPWHVDRPTSPMSTADLIKLPRISSWWPNKWPDDSSQHDTLGNCYQLVREDRQRLLMPKREGVRRTQGRLSGKLYSSPRLSTVHWHRNAVLYLTNTNPKGCIWSPKYPTYPKDVIVTAESNLFLISIVIKGFHGSLWVRCYTRWGLKQHSPSKIRPEDEP